MVEDENLILDNQLCFALYSASLAMTQLYKPLLEPIGLTYPQYLVMLILWESDGVGLKDIALKLNQKSGSLTPVIKRLEEEGFIHRERLPENERQLYIKLSQKGMDLKAEARLINQCIGNQCGLDTETVISLRNQLQELRKHLMV